MFCNLETDKSWVITTPKNISYLAHHWVRNQNVDPAIREFVCIELVDQTIPMAFFVNSPGICSGSKILRRRHLEINKSWLE